MLNPFGQNMTDAGAAAIIINANAGLRAEQQVFAGSLTGEAFDLPAGPVDFSTGFEWRYSTAEYIPDTYLASGDVSGWNAGPEAILEAMYQDKKVSRGALTFILARGVGQSFIAKGVAPEPVLDFLRDELDR